MGSRGTAASVRVGASLQFRTVCVVTVCSHTKDLYENDDTAHKWMHCTFHVATYLQYSLKVTLTESFAFWKMLAKSSFLLAVLPQGGCIEDTVTQWPYMDSAYSPRSILGDSIMTHCSAHSELNFMVTNQSICGSSMFLQPLLSP